MELRDYIEDLLVHMEWADANLWKSILDSTLLVDDAAVRDRLYHIHSVQWAFLNIWHKEPVDVPPIDKFVDLKTMSLWAQKYYPEMKKYFEGISREELSQDLIVPGSEQIEEKWGIHPATADLSQTILQIVTHTTHHRAQVYTRMRELKIDSPVTDFIVWIWFGKPRPQWPA